jgi:carboxypeptidase T
MEISAHLADGSHPPGVLFDALTHGLEHLSLEMPLAIMGWLLDGYGHDPTITRLVETRAIFIVFDVNPDGAAFDIAGGRFHEWRKNRQPEPGGAIGTDLNRNYPSHWGCCGLVSSKPASAYYRGSAPFSAPETQAMRDFVRSLVFDGRQEIRVSISFHASGRLILWPYGYTTTAIPGDMTASAHKTFVALGTAMARLNGYRPEQASSLYLDSGTARDWYYGSEGIFAFTFELGTGTYQPSAAIGPETARNRSAILYLIGMADCPSRAAGVSC